MNVKLETKDLDPEDQKEFEALLSKSGRNPGEVLRQLVHEALQQRACGDEAEDSSAIARQQEELERLYQKLVSLPVAVDDGLSGRNHDQILYGSHS